MTASPTCPECSGLGSVEGITRSTQAVSLITCPTCDGRKRIDEIDCGYCGATLELPREDADAAHHLRFDGEDVSYNCPACRALNF